MGRMRSPSLSIHGIEGAFSGAGGKTVIPAKVSGKFSIRCGRREIAENCYSSGFPDLFHLKLQMQSILSSKLIYRRNSTSCEARTS